MGLKVEGEKVCFTEGLLTSSGSNRYLALYTGAAGSETEVDVEGYTPLSLATTDWDDNADASNATALTMASPTADDDAALSAWGLVDASSGGNILWQDRLDTGTITLATGSQITAAIGALDINTTDFGTGTTMGVTEEGAKKMLKGGLLGATVYIALHSAAPTQATPSELSGNSYARVTKASTTWTIDSASGQASNTTAVTWPTATGTWTQPTHIGLWTAATGGNLLYRDAFDASITAPTSGQTVQINASGLTITIPTD